MVIRLDKYLCDMQAGTRSAVKDIIRKKRVTINGEVITRPEIKVDIDKDVVAVDNNVLGYSEYEYYMLNKPAGVVSAVSDKDFKTVVELITRSSSTLRLMQLLYCLIVSAIASA